MCALFRTKPIEQPVLDRWSLLLSGDLPAILRHLGIYASCLVNINTVRVTGQVWVLGRFVVRCSSDIVTPPGNGKSVTAVNSISVSILVSKICHDNRRYPVPDFPLFIPSRLCSDQCASASVLHDWELFTR